MDLDLGWLKDFLAVIDAGGFSRAAERRHISQPALSRRIRSLEEWLGTPLFERNTHSVQVTPAGRSFRPFAEDMLRRVEAARERVLETAHATLESVHFAATHVLSQRFFPDWIRPIQAREPGISIQLFAANMSICERLLIDGEVNFLLSYDHPLAPTRLQASRFHSVVLGTEQLVPVSIPQAPGSPAPRFQLPGSSREPLPHLSYHTGSGLGRILDAFLKTRERSLFLTPTFVAPAALLTEMALDGAGLAWLPTMLVHEELTAGHLVRAGTDDWNVPVEIRLFRPRSRLKKSAERIWKTRSVAAEQTEEG